MSSVHHYVSYAFDQPQSIASDFSQFFVSTLLVFVATILAWRYVRPAALQLVHPRGPRELPSWTPYFGHLLSYWSDFGIIMKQARSTAYADAPCSITLGGASLCIIASSDDAEYVLKHPSFSHEEVVWIAAKGFGMSKKGYQQSFMKAMNVTKKELASFNRNDGMPIETLRTMYALSSGEKKASRSVIQGTGKPQMVNLSRWIREIMSEISVETYFGSAMMRIDPQLPEALFDFDDRFWMLMCGVPMPWSLKMRKCLRRYQRSLTAYMATPKSEREDSSELLKLQESCMEREKLSAVDVTAIVSMTHWGMNTNPWKAVFWCMCYAISKPTLLSALRAEVAPLLASNPTPLALARDIKSCRLLNSLFLETMRVTSATSSLRLCTKSATIPSGTRVTPNTYMLIVYQEMLKDTDTFGADAGVFRADRFVGREDIAKPPAFRPFGGGAGQCPGRFMAHVEILALVALLITKYEFDASLMGGEVPEMDLRAPMLGVVAPKKGQDMKVLVSPREG